MLKVTNLAQVNKTIDDWLAAVEAEITQIAKGLAFEAMVHLEDHSPQYSGDFAANWNMSVNTPDTTFVAGIFPGKQFPSKAPFVLGDMPAMTHAFGQASGNLDGFKLGDTIWLTNAAAHHNDPYARSIESGRMTFRPGNDGMPIYHTLNVLRIDYATIDKSAADKLKGAVL